MPFDGPGGVKTILLELCERHGWVGEREHEAGEIISLRRGEASITLEPGAQLELGGAPVTTIHKTHAELQGHMAELRDISDELGIAWLGLGFHPFARQADLPWVPKLRYGVMQRYLPTRGSMALDMMRRTATVQANFDYESEADAVRKLRVMLALTPVLTAMFANSPFIEGRPAGGPCHRAAVWLDVDPDRTGLLPFAWADDFGYRAYVEWALDVPMFLVKRHGKILENTGQSFRAFLRDGFSGATATREDWVMHLNTLFPEVRLKNTIEVRSVDSQPGPLACALPALLKGILYDEAALTQAEALISGLTHESVAAARLAVPRLGLRATMADRKLEDWGRAILAIADGALRRMGNLDRAGRDETVHLERLQALAKNGRSPADALLAEIDESKPLLPQILEKTRL